MRLRILTLLFCLIGLTSSAQRFGVDAGYAYTLNTFKGVPYTYNSNFYHNLHCRQYAFPNFSFCTYARLHRRIYLCLGADIVKYRIKDALAFYTPDNPGYIFDYSINETHVPLLIRIEAFRFKDKHPFSLYGGVFGRFIGKRSGGFSDPLTGEELERPKLFIQAKSPKYLSLTGGIHQAFHVKPCLELYVDARLKYMPGYYSTPIDAMYAFIPMQVSNKFACSLSAGVSLCLADKEKEPNNNLGRLQD